MATEIKEKSGKARKMVPATTGWVIFVAALAIIAAISVIIVSILVNN